MADESNFIVQILLEARDNATAKVAALRAEVAALKREAETGRGGGATAGVSKDLDDTGRAARDAERDVRGARTEHERLRQSSRGNEVRQGGRDLDDMSAAARRSADNLGRSRAAVDDHRSAASRLGATLGDTNRRFEESGEKAKSAGEKAEEAAKSYEMFDSAVRRGNVGADDARRGYAQFAQELGGIARGFRAGSDEALNFSRIASEAKARSGDFGPSEAEIRRVSAAYKDFDDRVKSGVMTTAQARRGYQDLSSELGAIGRAYRAGSTEAEHFLGMADKAAAQAKKAGYLSPGDWNIDNFIAKTAARFDSWGVQIVSLSANLRGLALAGIIGLAQQLDTAVVGLAGGLFSVASAAAQAGAALGGALVAGISQAIPALAVVAATVERLKSVFQAVGLNSQAQTAKETSPNKVASTQLQNSMQVAGAEHALANAYEAVVVAQEHVRSSQESLTLARVVAIRNITDLTLAEKDAKLQAEGASISLTEAQRALQTAIQSGNTAGIQAAQLSVQEAELAQRKAQIGIPRAEADANRAQRQGVEGNPSVVAARQAAQAARAALANQRFAVQQAKQQEQLAKLQQAEPNAGQASQQSQLNALTKRFTGPEKALYESLVRIEQMVRSPSGPLAKISDYLVEPFSKGISRIAGLLGSKSAMQPLDVLAKSMGGALTEVENTLTDSKAVHFFDEMAEDASKNVPIVGHAISQLLGFFQDIARTASPVLHEMLTTFDNFVTKLNARDSSPHGLERLSKFFERAAGYARDILSLAGAFVHLIEALGRNSAASGDNLIVSLTNSMNDATQWVNTHGPQVKRFFEETAQVVKQIGLLLFGIGGAMIKAFNPSSTAAFQQFLTQIILPALVKLLNILGWITTAILNIAKAIPGGTASLQIIAGIVATMFGISKLYSPFMKVFTVMKALVAATEAFTAASGMSRITAAWSAFVGVMQKAKAVTQETAAAQEALNAQEVAGAGAATADAAAQGALDVAEGAGGAAGAAAAAGGGAGLLARLGIGAGAGGLLSRLGGGALKGGAAGLVAYLGLGEAGKLIGGNAGSQISGGSSYAGIGAAGGALVGGPVGAAVGAAGGEIAHMIAQPDVTGFSGKGIPKIIGEINKSIEGGHYENAKKLAENLKLVSYEMSPDQASKIKKYLGVLEGTDGVLSSSAEATRKWADHMRGYLRSLGPEARNVIKSFETINTQTGSILDQVREVVNQNTHRIAEDLGTGSEQGKNALIANFGAAEVKIRESMAAGEVSTAKGMGEIGRLVSTALKEYGISPGKINAYVSNVAKFQAGNAAINAGKSVQQALGGGFAEGGWAMATPGGKLYTAGEDNHDEVVLTTDPRKAPRQRQLLGEYLSRAPHIVQGFADGGFVADPGTNFSAGREPEIVAALRKLAAAQHATIYGISGYRSPSHSVSVGGFSNDPHTRGEAADIGWNSNTRESMRSVAEALLRRFGLYRQFYPSSAAEVNHVELLRGGRGGQISSAPFEDNYEIEVPHIKGLSGGLKKVAQGALTKVMKAANQYLQNVLGSLPTPVAPNSAGASGGSFAGAKGSGGSSSANEKLGREMMIAYGFPASEWPDLQKLWTQESGWSATAENNPSMGWLANGNASGIPQADDHGNVYRKGDARGQIAWGLKYIRERWKTIAAAWASEVANHSYAIGGRIKSMAMAAGGMIAPWGGRPVNIVAHEGERVMNPMQYEEAARLAGTNSRGLDRHMGFNQGKPRQHFARGGIITGGTEAPPSLSSTPSLPNLERLSISALSSNSGIAKVFKAVHDGFKALDKINVQSSQFANAFIPFVNAITNEQTGIIARLTAAFTALTSRITSASARANFKPVSGSATLVSSASPLQQTEQSLKNLAIERKELQEQAKIIAEAEKQIKKKIEQLSHKKQTKAVKKELQQLVGAYNSLINAQLSVEEQAAANLEAAAQAAQQRVQDELTQINNVYGVQQAELSARQSMAQSLGRYGELPSIDAAIAQSARNKIGALEGALHDAEAIGNAEMAASIRQEIAGLQQTVVSATAQMITDAEQLVQQNAGWYGSFAQLYQTRAAGLAAKGNYGDEGAYAAAGYNTELYSDRYQISEDRRLLATAKAEGNTGQIYTLTEAINSLEGAIITNEQALKDNTATITQQYISQVTRQGQFSTGIYGGLISLLQTAGQITGSTNVGAEANLYKQSNQSLESTDQQIINGPQGLNNFLQQYGIQGVPNLSGLSGQRLISAISGMNIPAIEAQMDPAQQQVFEQMIQSLVANSEQIEINNKELATLNGQLLNPQSFSSAPWTQFRDAVFTGMGGLMPNVAASLGIPAAQNPALTGTGYGGASTGTSGVGRPEPKVVHVHVTNPTETIDPHYVGHAVAWQMKNET